MYGLNLFSLFSPGPSLFKRDDTPISLAKKSTPTPPGPTQAAPSLTTQIFKGICTVGLSLSALWALQYTLTGSDDTAASASPSPALPLTTSNAATTTSAASAIALIDPQLHYIQAAAIAPIVSIATSLVFFAPCISPTQSRSLFACIALRIFPTALPVTFLPTFAMGNPVQVQFGSTAWQSDGEGLVANRSSVAVKKDQDATTELLVINTHNGNAARSRITAGIGSGSIAIGMHGTNHLAAPNEAWLWASGTNVPLVFGTLGTERMRITPEGMVGVGITNPSAMLDIWGRSNSQPIFRGNTGASTPVSAFEFLAYNQDGNNAGLIVRTFRNGTMAELLRITPTGINIRSSTLAAMLNILGSPDKSIFFFRPEADAANFGSFSSANGNTIAYLGSGNGAAITAGSAQDFAIRAENNLIFAAGGDREAVRITPNGHVGIGITPDGPLDVKINTEHKITFLMHQTQAPSIAGHYLNGSSSPLRLSGLPLTLSGDGGNGATHLTITSSGQVYIPATLSVGTPTPHPSAKLEVSSTTQGFLPPRMTVAQRDAIVSPLLGLIVYTTDTDQLCFKRVAGWHCMP